MRGMYLARSVVTRQITPISALKTYEIGFECIKNV